MRLSTKLELLCVPAPASSTDSTAVSANGSPDLEPAAAYAHSVLRTLADVLAAKVEASHADVAKYADRLAPRLFALFAGAAFLAEDTPGGAVAADARLLAVAAQIVTLITQTLGAPRQEAFVKAVFGAFVDSASKVVVEGVTIVSVDVVGTSESDESSSVTTVADVAGRGGRDCSGHRYFDNRS